MRDAGRDRQWSCPAIAQSLPTSERRRIVVRAVIITTMIEGGGVEVRAECSTELVFSKLIIMGLNLNHGRVREIKFEFKLSGVQNNLISNEFSNKDVTIYPLFPFPLKLESFLFILFQTELFCFNPFTPNFLFFLF